MRGRSVRVAMLGMALLASVGAGGCVAPPAPAAFETVSCGGGSAEFSVDPGFSAERVATTMTMRGSSTEAACNDGTGRGITSVHLQHFSIHFEFMGCGPQGSEVGTGGGTLRWSDGSTSDVAATMSFSDFALHLTVTSGRLVGMSGSAGLSAWPTQGDCTIGITGLHVEMHPIVLRRA